MRDLSLPPLGREYLSPPAAVTQDGRQRRDATIAVTEAIVRILVCDPGDGAELGAYARYLCDLLGGRLSSRHITAKDPLPGLLRAARNHDLLLFGEPAQPALSRFLVGALGPRVASRSAATVLLARKPRWPIRNILLALRVEPSEQPAVHWTGHFASASGARLTILPLVPPQPALIGAGNPLYVGIDALLAPKTPSGRRLRGMLTELERWQVNGTLRVRQGEPLWQICWEIDAGDYDLVIIGTDTGGPLKRLLFGELVRPLLERVDRPVLVVSAARDRNQARAAADVQ